MSASIEPPAAKRIKPFAATDDESLVLKTRTDRALTFAKDVSKDRGTCAVVSGPSFCCVVTSVTDPKKQTNPSKIAKADALRRLKASRGWEALTPSERDQKLSATAIGYDCWNVGFAGMTVGQSVLSLAAGLTEIEYADSDDVSPEAKEFLHTTRSVSLLSNIGDDLMSVGFLAEKKKGWHDAEIDFGLEKFRPFVEIIDMECPELRFGSTFKEMKIYHMDANNQITLKSTFTRTPVPEP